MKRLLFDFSQSYRILTRHKFITSILMVQCALCLLIIGNVSGKIFESNKRVEFVKENITGKQYYNFYEGLNDSEYFRLMSDDSIGYQELTDYVQRLLNEEEFTYVSIMSQPVSVIKTDIPEGCLYGYESGDAGNASVTLPDGQKALSAKSYQVSANFFDEFKIELDSGTLFDEADYEYTAGKEIPVILGSAYRDSFSVGDTFKAEYMYQIIPFKVKGILREDTAFSYGEEIEFCDRYIIFPQFDLQPDHPTSFNKMRLLQSAGGFAVAKKSYKEIADIVNSIINETGATGVGLMPSEDAQENDLGQFDAMSGDVSRQFSILLAILSVFVILSISAAVNGFIRESHYEFGVFLLNGAEIWDIAWSVAGVVACVVLTGNLVASLLIVMSSHHNSILYMQVIMLIIVVLSCIAPLFHVARLNISDLIGGKE